MLQNQTLQELPESVHEGAASFGPVVFGATAAKD